MGVNNILIYNIKDRGKAFYFRYKREGYYILNYSMLEIYYNYNKPSHKVYIYLEPKKLGKASAL
jgi:hypothetical protein